ncbi:hypothetical protein [Anoxybacillus flavithermus]|uniref:Uncharacterized protein n=1 Tax=Anoxybacillus flavithermus (strain DSM 21510 / WK1) TaxID=491915 RepID=B7GIX4_ANOFW|nr:hypothetical protein [Anoxybacillus flavithermus]ACJ33165.1 Predicted protein, contains Zn-ribbon domain [Anoxybacillus flavithermus WK1]
MRLDIYTCSTCGEGFSVEEDKQPITCPLCESKLFEFSNTIIGSKIELDYADMELFEAYIQDFLRDVRGIEKIESVFTEILDEIFIEKSKEYAKNPANWGACCKWPDDDLPF